MSLATTQTSPTCRPGERLIAGRPSIFNMGLLNAHLADEALSEAPADLSGLSDDDLTGLFYNWLNADARRRAEVREIGARICDERAARAAAPVLQAAE